MVILPIDVITMFFPLVRPIENGDFPSAWTKGARTSIPIPGDWKPEDPGVPGDGNEKIWDIYGKSMGILWKSFAIEWDIYGISRKWMGLNGTGKSFWDTYGITI